MIVTIDGPAGSGKSTAARGLASRLGFEFLDTGSMYRAVALALNRLGVAYEAPEVESLLAGIHVDMEPGKVLLDGEEVTQLIRTPDLSSGASKVATVPCVRHYLVKQQRQIARGRQMVCEGRDQGTVVFPHAECKFFLVASPLSRARRRMQDLLSRGHQTTLEVVLREQEERDQRDSSRSVGALRPAEDAIHLDTSDLSIDEVLNWMEQRVRERCPRG
jgi:cytidylate kinase